MTLGAFTGYFRKRVSKKNISFPYSEYGLHYILGIIYSRADLFTAVGKLQESGYAITTEIRKALGLYISQQSEEAFGPLVKLLGEDDVEKRERLKAMIDDCLIDEKKRYTIGDLPAIMSVVRDFDFFVQEKWKIASDRPGSGNTKNIGLATTIDELKNGAGIFTTLDNGEAVFNDYWMYYLTKDMAKAIDSTPPYRNLQTYLEIQTERGAMTNLFLPTAVRRVRVPPIKCQGIKTKLVPFVAGNIQWTGEGRWIEPFLGSGVVAFNLAPQHARLADTNKHIINLYRSIQEGHTTDGIVRERLTEMGSCLRTQGESYFYEVRERFNEKGDPLDLLFLNRSCFNGVMRFNSKGLYNVPFGKKIDRFRKAYVTKIVNQIHWLSHVLREHPWEIECLDWKECLKDVNPGDFVYLDPPYIGRHTDYFNRWNMKDAEELAQFCHRLPCGYALSMWKSNKYRENDYLTDWWKDDDIRTFTHFYHVGSKEALRHEMIEALAIKSGYSAPIDYWVQQASHTKESTGVQLLLFDDADEVRDQESSADDTR